LLLSEARCKMSKCAMHQGFWPVSVIFVSVSCFAVGLVPGSTTLQLLSTSDSAQVSVLYCDAGS
jgi:hypothetical protein